MKRILLATTNPGKLKEIQAMLCDYSDFEIVSLEVYPDIPAPEETGTSFFENALLKHDYYRQLTGETVLAEDSGLCVEALNGAPGVYSARYANTTQDKISRLLHDMESIGAYAPSRRSAHFECCAVVTAPHNPKAVLVSTERFLGNIAMHPSGDGGFGYDPIFHVPSLGKTSAEMTLEEKNSFSHRRAIINVLDNLK